MNIEVLEALSPKVHTAVITGSSLSSGALPDEYLLLFGRIEEAVRLEQSRRQAHARVWELARQQGVEPIRDIKELQGDFWPEEESVDEFLDWVRAVRQQGKSEHRSD